MPTQTTFNLQDYINSGVRSQLFAGGGIGFSVNQAITCAYSDSLIPDSDTPFSSKTLFDIASITKSMVAIVIMKFIEEGRLGLDHPLIWYVDGIGNGWENITIQHLLTNSVEFDIKDRLEKFTAEDIEMIITTSNVTRFGDGWYYHNSSSILLGWVLEKITGMPLEKIIRKEVFEPAEMHQTFFSTEIPSSALMHVHPSFNTLVGNDVLIGAPHDATSYRFTERRQSVGSSGVFATVEDMVKFGNFVLYKAFKNPDVILAKIAFNHLKEFKHKSGQPYSSGLGFDNPKPDYVCPCFEKEAIITTGHTGVFLCIQTVQKKVLTILSNITYPVIKQERPPDALGIPVNPLFEYRKKLARTCFACSTCN